jgi:hypothetical protein
MLEDGLGFDTIDALIDEQLSNILPGGTSTWRSCMAGLSSATNGVICTKIKIEKRLDTRVRPRATGRMRCAGGWRLIAAAGSGAFNKIGQQLVKFGSVHQ